MGEEHILYPGNLELQQVQHIRLAEQADGIVGFGAGQDGVHHRVFAPVDAFYLHLAAWRQGGVAAGDLGKRAFHMVFVMQQLAFEGVHRMGDHFTIRQIGGDQLNRFAVEFAGDAKLVLFQRRGFGRRGGSEVEARPDAHIERKRQVLALFACLVEIEFEMTPGIDIDRQRVFVDHLEALDRRVAHAGIGILGNDHRRVEIGAAILGRMHGRRQLGHIDRLLGDFAHRAVLQHHRMNRVDLPFFDVFRDQHRKLSFRRAHQRAKEFARPVQTGQHRRGVTLHVFEQHGARAALEFRRDAGEIEVEIDFRFHPHQTAHGVEIFDDRGDIFQMFEAHGRIPVSDGNGRREGRPFGAIMMIDASSIQPPPQVIRQVRFQELRRRSRGPAGCRRSNRDRPACRNDRVPTG